MSRSRGRPYRGPISCSSSWARLRLETAALSDIDHLIWGRILLLFWLFPPLQRRLLETCGTGRGGGRLGRPKKGPWALFGGDATPQLCHHPLPCPLRAEAEGSRVGRGGFGALKSKRSRLARSGFLGGNGSRIPVSDLAVGSAHVSRAGPSLGDRCDIHILVPSAAPPQQQPRVLPQLLHPNPDGIPASKGFPGPAG